MNLLSLMLLALVWCFLSADNSFWDSLKLPVEHIPYYFRNNPKLKTLCKEDENCPYKTALSKTHCWGYEKTCKLEHRMSNPTCPDSSRGWTQEKAAQLENFWTGADFGYVKEKRKELKFLCEPQQAVDSSLECVKYTRFCRARNIYMDFRGANLKSGRDRYRENLFASGGKIGGHCILNKAALRAEGEHKSPLQSWYAELEHYSALDFHPIEDKQCDIVIDKPTYLMKLDAGVNMYHHFCDFVNLYVAQHLNNNFTTDIFIVMWDTSPLHYGDFFYVTWKAFTDYPIIRLDSYDDKRVCFRDAVFPLLPRLRWGLFYNMPLIPGCYGSSMMRAFSQHVLHRLNITQDGPLDDRIRITLLSRNTKYRNILNQEELVGALKTVTEFEVRVVEYNPQVPFLDQLKSSYNSDIFMGMHGAGLTHMLFLPDWAVGIELYNCEDDGCYYDLARLRGIKYMTWERKEKLTQEDEGHHPTLGAHAKFTNYAFEVNEFMRLIFKAADHVRSHKDFTAQRLQRSSRIIDEL